MKCDCLFLNIFSIPVVAFCVTGNGVVVAFLLHPVLHRSLSQQSQQAFGECIAPILCFICLHACIMPTFKCFTRLFVLILLSGQLEVRKLT